MAEIKIKIKKKDGTYFDVDKYSGLKSLKITTQSTPAPNDIFYGLVPSSGEVIINDVNGAILDDIKNDLIDDKNLEVDIYINGTKKQHFFSKTNKYHPLEKTFSIQLTDIVDSLKDIKLNTYKSTSSKTMYQVFANILSAAGLTTNQFDFSDYAYVAATSNISAHKEFIADYLINFKFPDVSAYYNKNTTYNLLENICKTIQVSMHQNKNGKIKISPRRPVVKSSDVSPIDIPSMSQYSYPETNIFVKNKYDNVKNKKENEEISIQSFVNEYSLLNASTPSQYSYTSIPNYKIVQISGDDYVCFFVNIKNNTLLSNSVTYSANNIYPVRIYYIDADNQERWGSISGSISNAPDYIDMNSFNFETMMISVSRDNFDCVRLPFYSNLNEDVFAIRVPILDASFGVYEKLAVTINEKVSTQTTVDELFNNNTNIYENKNTNEFLKTPVYYKRDNEQENIYNLISNHISTDYQYGIRTAKVTVGCRDYYSGVTRIKKWEEGDILEVGDIVKINKDNNGNSRFLDANGNIIYWQVTGRTFRYAGAPYIDLELQEVKFI